MGTEWTVNRLTNHGNRVTRGEFAKTDTHSCKGVRSSPEFTAVHVSHYVLPLLHIIIGKVNDVLRNLIAQLQVAAEIYTDKY